MSRGLMSVRGLCLITVLTTIIFVQEELLALIPNVQLTFLLFVVYGATLPLPYTLLIMCAHVLLDNLFMSSFRIEVILPMLLGYLPTILLAYLFRNKNEYIQAIVGVVGSILYALSFAILNVFLLDIEFVPYVIADIPFTIILSMSSALTIIFLYKPIKRIIVDNLNRFK